MYNGVLFDTDVDLSPERNLVSPRKLAMRDEDIWSHTHRMYLLGDNSIKFPWYLPKPTGYSEQVLDDEDMKKLKTIIKEKQNSFNWSMG